MYKENYIAVSIDEGKNEVNIIKKYRYKKTALEEFREQYVKTQKIYFIYTWLELSKLKKSNPELKFNFEIPDIKEGRGNKKKENKKRVYALRLPPDVIEWLRSQKNASKLILEAILKTYKI